MKVSLIAILIAFTIPLTALGSSVGTVVDIMGNSFSFYGTKHKKTVSLRYGSKIPDLSEVMVEDGSYVTIRDEHGRIFHLSGGTYAKFFNNIVELKNGYIWASSTNASQKGEVHTINSITKYGDGQFIYSFDNISGKSQLLVLDGYVHFSNALEPDVAVSVHAGSFTLVDQNYDKGLPRSPTRVGLASYKSMKSVFNEVDSLKNTNFDQIFGGAPKTMKTKRAIASVGKTYSGRSYSSKRKNVKKGKVIHIQTYSAARIPASNGPMKYYGSHLNDVKKTHMPVKTGNHVEVRMHGFSSATPIMKRHYTAPKSTRIPASVRTIKTMKKVKRLPASVEKSQLLNELNSPSEIEKSLLHKQQQNKRHSNEVNHLIDELDSYKSNLSKEY